VAVWSRARKGADLGARLAADRVTRTRRLPGARPDAASVLVESEGLRLWATVRERATPTEVHGEALAAALGALRGAGLEVVGITESTSRCRLAVTAVDPRIVLEALAPLGPGWYVGERVRDHLVGVTAVADLDTTSRDGSRVLAVLRPVTDVRGRGVLGVREAVQVEVWAPGADGATAPVRNRWTTSLPASEKVDAVVRVAGVDVPTHATIARGHVDDLTFPVDAVLTWVDGDDAAWRDRMAQARTAADADRHDARAVSESRFRSLDELRYALRALEAFAPWIRHVWLVTDAQTPSWLAEDHAGLTVVDHREIWADPDALPVFNSHAIESQLHRIDGLAEHYVYVNDDVLLRRPLEPSAFFSPGGVLRIHPSLNVVGLGPATTADSAPVAALKNDRALLERTGSRVPASTFWHVPHPQRVSVQAELEAAFAAEFAATAAHRFRSPADISAVSLGMWHAYRTGRAVPGTLTCRYVDLVDAAGLAAMRDVAKHDAWDVVCLNQSTDPSVDAGEVAHLVSTTLDRWYPFPSRWERPDA